MPVVGVDQLVSRRRRLRQDAEPGEGVLLLEGSQGARRGRVTADAVGAVAPGEPVTAHLVALAVVTVADRRRRAGEVVHAHDLGFEQELATGVEAGADEVLDDLVLAVHRDGAAGLQVAQRDPVVLALEAQADTVVDESLVPEAVTHPGGAEQINGALLEDAGANTFLDAVA